MSSAQKCKVNAHNQLKSCWNAYVFFDVLFLRGYCFYFWPFCFSILDLYFRSSMEPTFHADISSTWFRTCQASTLTLQHVLWFEMFENSRVCQEKWLIGNCETTPCPLRIVSLRRCLALDAVSNYVISLVCSSRKCLKSMKSQHILFGYHLLSNMSIHFGIMLEFD